MLEQKDMSARCCNIGHFEHKVKCTTKSLDWSGLGKTCSSHGIHQRLCEPFLRCLNVCELEHKNTERSIHSSSVDHGGH